MLANVLFHVFICHHVGLPVASNLKRCTKSVCLLVYYYVTEMILYLEINERPTTKNIPIASSNFVLCPKISQPDVSCAVCLSMILQEC
jgi:hypothetical protein